QREVEGAEILAPRLVIGDDVNAPRPRAHPVDEETRRLNYQRIENRVDRIARRAGAANILRQRDLVADLDLIGVDGQAERTAVDHPPDQEVSRLLGLAQLAA